MGCGNGVMDCGNGVSECGNDVRECGNDVSECGNDVGGYGGDGRGWRGPGAQRATESLRVRRVMGKILLYWTESADQACAERAFDGFPMADD